MSTLARFLLLAGACLAFLALVLSVVDLAPRVEADFFFASDDPELAGSAAVEKLFPSSPQILIRAAGEVDDPQYLKNLGALTDALEQIPGVENVTSLTKGPSSPAAAAGSPLWKPVLLPGPGASSLIVELDEGASAPLIRSLEDTLAGFEDRLELDVSGVPFVVERIRRHLLRDLRIFSLISLIIFGLAAALIYRSLSIAGGTLISSLTACGLTLLVLHLLDLRIGLLTANIVTIVFVLALSHMIFLSANWKLAEGEGKVRALAAVNVTFPASFWCMATTALGFASLLLASARPMRELGIAGVVGALAALAAGYGIFPLFLRLGAGSRNEPAGAFGGVLDASGTGKAKSLLPGTLLVIALTLLALPGLWRLNTDPSLLEYFDRDGELYAGLAAIDRDGGSSPLQMVLSSPDGASMHQGAAFQRLRQVQKAAEEDPAVGSAFSLPLLFDEARTRPFSGLLNNDQMLALLDSPKYNRAASTFVTADRKQALLYLRMREGGRVEDREAVVDRLKRAAANESLRVDHVGGLYDLQGRLGQLVSKSLLNGLGGLALLFAAIALWVARSVRTAAAMVAGLIALPVLIFGTFGYLALPVDVITSPAANVAIGLGIDSMIHLVLRRRRLRAEGLGDSASWNGARSQMKAPILTATLVVAAGFGVFALSSFPPTRHFGIAVVLGTCAAAAWALTALPFLAGAKSR